MEVNGKQYRFYIASFWDTEGGMGQCFYLDPKDASYATDYGEGRTYFTDIKAVCLQHMKLSITERNWLIIMEEVPS